MAKLKDLGPALERHGFKKPEVRKNDKELRFKITAVHQKRGVLVTISAPKKCPRHEQEMGKRFNKRHLQVRVVGPLAPVNLVVTSLGAIEKILQDIACGKYNRLAA